jgi:hypothetical protein
MTPATPAASEPPVTESAARPLVADPGYSVSSMVLRRSGGKARLSGRVVATPGCRPPYVMIEKRAPGARRWVAAKRVVLRGASWRTTLRARRGTQFRIATPATPACATAASPATRV